MYEVYAIDKTSSFYPDYMYMHMGNSYPIYFTPQRGESVRIKDYPKYLREIRPSFLKGLAVEEFYGKDSMYLLDTVDTLEDIEDVIAFHAMMQEV